MPWSRYASSSKRPCPSLNALAISAAGHLDTMAFATPYVSRQFWKSYDCWRSSLEIASATAHCGTLFCRQSNNQDPQKLTQSHMHSYETSWHHVMSCVSLMCFMCFHYPQLLRIWLKAWASQRITAGCTQTLHKLLTGWKTATCYHILGGWEAFICCTIIAIPTVRNDFQIPFVFCVFFLFNLTFCSSIRNQCHQFV